jgi:hypothetical protein
VYPFGTQAVLRSEASVSRRIHVLLHFIMEPDSLRLFQSEWVFCTTYRSKIMAKNERHKFYQIKYIHTYHSRFIPEGVSEASQIYLRDAHVLPKLFSYEEYNRRDWW